VVAWLDEGRTFAEFSLEYLATVLVAALVAVRLASVARGFAKDGTRVPVIADIVETGRL